jgi:uncharacterized membrane protein YjjB (DUF3815 family)
LALLQDIENNARLGAIMVWPLIGGAAGYWLASLIGSAAGALVATIFVGMLVGLCVGLFAAIRSTRVALILSLPGVIALFWG